MLLFFISIIVNFLFILFGFSDLDLVSKQIATLSPIFIIYLLFVRVFLEEWFFRGFLVSKTNIIISTLLFAIAHYGYGSIVEIIGALILGFVLALYYKKINNILPLFVAHFLYNFIVILFVFI